MNNSFFTKEEIQEDKITPILKQQEGELISVIEAIEELQKFPPWLKLSTTLFEPLTERLEKSLMVEANQLELNTSKINRLQGELKWSKKFSKLEDLKQFFKKQLTGIRIKLHDK